MIELKLEGFEFKHNSCTYSVDAIIGSETDYEMHTEELFAVIGDIEITEAWIENEGRDPVRVDLTEEAGKVDIIDLLNESSELEEAFSNEVRRLEMEGE